MSNHKCPKCKKTFESDAKPITCPECKYVYCGLPMEIYSRVVGYLRPVKLWNKGKQAEFADRKVYKTPSFLTGSETADTVITSPKEK